MTILRGVSLVEHVIASIGNDLADGGLSEAELASCTLNGKPMPPSLLRWLAFNRGWTEFDFNPAKLDQTMGPAFKIFEKLLPDDFYSIRASYSDCTWWFLYAGLADDIGEYPVFLADVDDRYLVKLEYPGFDLFLADKLLGGYADPGALKQQSLLNFGGYSWCEIYGVAADIDGNEVEWEAAPIRSRGDL